MSLVNIFYNNACTIYRMIRYNSGEIEFIANDIRMETLDSSNFKDEKLIKSFTVV